ncbi:MAG: TIGR01777 family oxidoreductase [Anaerolineae bacterium]
MRVLITGGSGLIGRALIPELRAHDHEVLVLSRHPQKAGARPEEVSVIQWDAHTPTGWAHVLESADAVINLAGENIGSGLWTEAKKVRIVESRENAGHAVTEAIAMAKRKPGVLLQASGTGYYGTDRTESLDETAPAGKDWLAGVGVRWESSTEPVERYGVRRVLLRSGPVLSRRGGVLPRMMLPFKVFVGGRIGSGNQVISWIHIQDEARAIRFLLETPEAQGPFNLSAPNPVTNAEFGRTLASVMRRPFWFPVPGFALRLALGEMATLILDGQRAVPRGLSNLGFEFRYPRLRQALEDLLTTPATVGGER